MNIKLTIGLPHFEDYEGVYFTIQALKLYHKRDDIELLVADNSPTDSQHSKLVKALMYGMAGDIPCKYVSCPDVVGPAAVKNKVFENASGTYVLCMDSHVLLYPNAIDSLLDYYDGNSDTKDLLTGPMLYDNAKDAFTHFDQKWQGEMYGVWSVAWRSPKGIFVSVRDCGDGNAELRDFKDNRVFEDIKITMQNYSHVLLENGFKTHGTHIEDEPFEIPMQGAGLMSCRKDAWQGFNPDFYGFGAEEFYIQEKFRQAGYRAMCLPFLQWMHRFNRIVQPYAAPVYNKVRNYVIGFKDLSLDLMPIYEHFVEGGFMTKADWFRLLEDPIHNKEPLPENIAKKDLTGVLDISQVYNSELRASKFVGQFAALILKLANKCESVVEMTSNHETSIVFLQSKCKAVDSFQLKPHEKLTTYAQAAVASGKKWRFQPLERIMEPIHRVDMLYIDTEPLHRRLEMELETHAPNVRKYIVITNTDKYCKKDQNNEEGVCHPINRFLQDNPEWYLQEVSQLGTGIAILSKVEEERLLEPVYGLITTDGPGTHLKKMLKKYLGIVPTANCACNARAAFMDKQGPRWCNESLDLIVSWLREEHGRQKSVIPFFAPAVKKFVKIAIKRSEREAENARKIQKSIV